MKRLCYKHHCEEFDKLPGVERDKASDWITVKQPLCELCNLRHPEWGHSYIIIEGDPGHLESLLDELSERNYLTEVDFRLVHEEPACTCTEDIRNGEIGSICEVHGST